MSPLLTTIQLHHYGAPLDFPTRRHAIALTLILVCFRSVRFKLSNNQAKFSKQSMTADTAIRIVLLTLQGCTATHMKLSVTAFGLDTIQASVGEDNFHNLYLTAFSKFKGAAYLGWFPHRELGRSTEVVPEDVCVVRKPVSVEPFSHLATRPQTYQNSELLRLTGPRRGELLR